MLSMGFWSSRYQAEAKLLSLHLYFYFLLELIICNIFRRKNEKLLLIQPPANLKTSPPLVPMPLTSNSIYLFIANAIISAPVMYNLD
jgi:hypothetical protein